MSDLDLRTKFGHINFNVLVERDSYLLNVLLDLGKSIKELVRVERIHDASFELASIGTTECLLGDQLSIYFCLW